MPYDTSTTIGFAIALISQMIAAFIGTEIFVIMNTFFVSICFYFIACISDVNSILMQIDGIALTATTKWSAVLIKKSLIDAIKLQNWAIRYFISVKLSRRESAEIIRFLF